MKLLHKILYTIKVEYYFAEANVVGFNCLENNNKVQTKINK
jgi:hypothetical protein